jgi:hypothetical protein
VIYLTCILSHPCSIYPSPPFPGCRCLISSSSPSAWLAGLILTDPPGREKISQQLFQLIHMAKSPTWGFSAETSVGLPGAHGSELVRSFCVFDQEQTVFTAGEDGQIIAWRPN